MRDYRVWPDNKEGVAIKDIFEEYELAAKHYPKFNSSHEAIAVLFEEVSELWELVKVKQVKHDLHAMREECKQIAAMALRFMIDICDKEK